jgi:hypothetical protein
MAQVKAQGVDLLENVIQVRDFAEGKLESLVSDVIKIDVLSQEIADTSASGVELHDECMSVMPQGQMYYKPSVCTRIH